MTLSLKVIALMEDVSITHNKGSRSSRPLPLLRYEQDKLKSAHPHDEVSKHKIINNEADERIENYQGSRAVDQLRFFNERAG